jgi:hypothetical protein
MARMDVRGSDTVTMEIKGFKGLNTATQFSQIDIRQSPRLLNLLPGKVGGLRTRKATRPITGTPTLGLKRMFRYRKNGVNSIVASAGTTLYKFDGIGAWAAQTMTVSLNTDDINAVQFRDESANEVLVIASSGGLEKYDGTTVNIITPLANDASPLPANYLSTINTTNPAAGITTHNNRLVIWPLNKDIIYHSKPGFYDYFPATSYQRFVKDNDYIQTCISFGSSLLVFMRNSVGVLFGDGYSSTPAVTDWSQDFLDTTDGCVNPRSVQIVVYPDGEEKVFYQTDRGISSVLNVDTKSLDNSTRLATRSMTDQKIDWDALKISSFEWANAVSYFHHGIYWLIYKQGTAFKGLAYDVTADEWFPMENIDATDFYGDEDYLYFINAAGHLKRFQDLGALGLANKDYADINLTTGTPIAWSWYSKLMNPQVTGFDHFWDVLMIEAQQFNVSSTINVEVNTFTDHITIIQALKTNVMIVGSSIIGQAQIGNPNLSDIVNNAKRLRIFAHGQYCQIRLYNDDGEPVELYDIRFEVRVQGTYG